MEGPQNMNPVIPLLVLAAFAYLAWKLWDDSACWIGWALREYGREER